MVRLIVVLVCAACASSAQEAPQLRLDGNVRPKEYSASLRIVPNEETFSGSIDIEVELRQPSKLIWLHAADLKLSEAVLDGKSAKVVPGNADFQGLAFDAPVNSGRLHIRYTGPINRKNSTGIFQMKDGDNWYVYTQFEAISARRAFPCFDEPAYKTPWQLTLEVRKDDIAFSNTPVLSETPSADGMKTVRFAKTRPLPSYLVAMAVGPFEIVPARNAGAGNTPVRIIVPKGRKAEAEYAAKVTPEILEQLEKYFTIPYPYPKLDSIAVPLFGGAMENAGLVTYNMPLILSKPPEDSIQRQRGYTRIAMHELGHQWFGDLVTMKWWDDVWLNEAFATWIENHVVAEWQPSWGDRELGVQTRLEAMGQDSLVSARRIRQPIESNNDIANAFDGITYVKGASVIRMFESWIGTDTFRRGIKSYLDQYSDRNADVSNFLEAIGRAAGKDVAQPFSTFLDQAGIPVVSMALRCEAGKVPSLQLSQKRLLPHGSKGSTAQTWKVPVCVAYDVESQRRRECTVLTTEGAAWELPGAKACPAWISGNADGSGYYHVRYEGDLLERAVADSARHLTAPERISTIGDVAALVKSGDLSAAQGLKLVPEFSKDRNRLVVQRTINISDDVGSSFLVPQDLRPNFVRFINRTYSDRIRTLGWTSKPGEDADTKLMRPAILNLVAQRGDVPELNSEARRLARAWLADRKAIEPEIVDTVLTAAATHGDAELYDEFLKAARASQGERDRGRLLNALGSFRDPVLAERSLKLLLGSDFDPRESLVALLFGPLSQPETRELPYQFVKANYDELLARVGSGLGDFDPAMFLPFTAIGYCSKEKVPEFQGFFEERMKQRTGGPRKLAQALETVELCDASVQAQRASVREFLSHY